MLIKEVQIEKFGAPSRDAFVIKTIAFLRKNVPEWTKPKTDEEIASSIEEMVKIAADRRVRKEVNIQKLLYHAIAYQLELPFSKPLELQLAQAAVGEDYRLKCFIKKIQKHGVR